MREQSLADQNIIIRPMTVKKLEKLEKSKISELEEQAITKSDIKTLINLIRHIEIETRKLSGLKKFM